VFEEEKKDDDDDEKKKPAEEEEPDEPISLLATIDKDEASVTPDGCWTFRMANSDGVPVPHAPVSAHSLIWPGAVTVARRNTFVNVYVGWGLKYSSTPYTPPPPPVIQAEFVAEFNPEDGETDPLVEQVDPLPPPKVDDDRKDIGDDDDGDVDDPDQDDS